MVRKVLLVCGILSSLLYVAMLVVIAMRWEGYSSASQTVSELSAIGAPTRALWVVPAAFYTVLVTAFGWGVWKSAGRSRVLHIVGASIAAYGALGLIWPFAPMHLRETLAAGGGTLTDTMHIVLASVTVVLMLLAIAFGASAFERGFRLYSIASLLILAACGALTFIDAPGIAANLPTPWIGVWERINIGVFLLWVIVLAVVLLRVRNTASARSASAFRTPAGEAAYLAAYDAAMKSWPVPYEEMEIPSRFGTTHVVACGPREAPPLVLLHGYWATLTMWTLNIADFSTDYRVYAIDVMGQPSKSVPDEPIRSAADYVAWLTATLDGLRLGRVSLVGMSYGAWLALSYAVAAPARVRKLALLSPAASFLPIVRQFSLRGTLMLFLRRRALVNWFMRWLTFKDDLADPETLRVGGNVAEMMYLGLKHFRTPQETLRVVPTVFADGELRAMHVPTLLLIGDREVIYDPALALARARRLIPDFEGDLVPRSSHDMCFRQHRLVDRRVLDFLNSTRTESEVHVPDRVVA
jgi:pimeloyl-ACP methyl ester carboxylesterase